MKIQTGITEQEMKRIVFEASNTVPSSYIFKISIDNKKYDAKLYCYVIYDEKTVRNPITGILDYSQKGKKTINRIEIYNLDIDNKKKIANQKIFKVDKEDYYLGEIEISKLNDITTIIAISANKF